LKRTRYQYASIFFFAPLPRAAQVKRSHAANGSPKDNASENSGALWFSNRNRKLENLGGLQARIPFWFEGQTQRVFKLTRKQWRAKPKTLRVSLAL